MHHLQSVVPGLCQFGVSFTVCSPWPVSVWCISCNRHCFRIVKYVHYFFRPGRCKNCVVTAVIGRECHSKLCLLWSLQCITDHIAVIAVRGRECHRKLCLLWSLQCSTDQKAVAAVIGREYHSKLCLLWSLQCSTDQKAITAVIGREYHSKLCLLCSLQCSTEPEAVTAVEWKGMSQQALFTVLSSVQHRT